MKYLKFEPGGRPYANDDFDVLQDEVYAALQAHLQGAPPLVISGCTVTQTNGVGSISPGFIWLAGNIQRYEGASNVTFPAEVVAGPYIDTDLRPYQTGGTKACMTERELLTQPRGTAPAGTALVTGSHGFELTYRKYIESWSRSLGEVQWIAAYDATLYDQSGKGHADQAAAGWALCNGQNSTADLRERFIVGMNPQAQDYAIGTTGGAASVTLTVPQLPAHTHTMQVAGEHAHSYTDNYNYGVKENDSGGDTRATRPGELNKTTGSAGSHTHINNETGSNQAHENRPPFYVLAARQWIGW
ncbi:hypothetical protein [Hymenobacter metallicola]|uniref:Tail fiber protein n=1 Tax=Hymenobacter metallicola TaxID=2563114 RepID=A0A4Z0Q494_9BACT|nr:hypothetical protein [Hymenobacter metallicola]TGE23542.1 hypothetical protein E5K02_20365 [Hymenobacter metallicola]